MRMSQISDSEQILLNYKIIILGMSTAGKTKLLTRYKYGVYQPVGSMTVAVDSYFVKTQTAKYQYYDTAGQDRFRSIVDSYYRNSDACLIVYDTNSLQSFQEIPFYYNRVKQLAPQSLIYLIGTKCDLVQKVSQDQVKKQYKSIPNFITSSKNGTNVIQTFKQIQAQLLDVTPKSLQMKKSKIKPIKVIKEKSTKNKNSQQNKCCKN